MDQHFPGRAMPAQNPNNSLAKVSLAIEPDLNVVRNYMPVFTPDLALQRYQIVNDIVDAVFTKGVDYGVIPGTGDKPTLLKPGAEKLCTIFAIVPSYEYEYEAQDWGVAGNEPLFAYRLKCKLNRIDHATGSEFKVGEGMGFCSSWESKYRYRWVDADLAKKLTGLDPNRIISRDGTKTLTEFAFAVEKAETEGRYGKPKEYWEQFQQAILNGTAKKVTREMGREKKPTEAWQITVGQVQYRIANPDFADQINTVLKMAMKRAMIAAVLVALNISDRFTQDVEDFVEIDYAYNDKSSTVATEQPQKQQTPAPPSPPAQQAPPTPTPPDPVQQYEAEIRGYMARLRTERNEVFASIFKEFLDLFGDTEGSRLFDQAMVAAIGHTDVSQITTTTPARRAFTELVNAKASMLAAKGGANNAA